MKIVIIAFMIIAIFVACKEPLGIEKNVNKNIIELELLPLAVGNKWKYLEENYDENGLLTNSSFYTLKVTDTHFAKNKLWYKVEKSDNIAIEHYYCINDEGLWYRVPQINPLKEVLILNYQQDENDILIYEDLFKSNDEDYHLETVLVMKNIELDLTNVEFYCYQYNVFKVDNLTKEKTLFKELYYSKGVGLVKELEYKMINNNLVVTSKRTLNIYNLEKTK